MYIAALSTIVKKWKQPNFHQQMNELTKCSISIQWTIIQQLKRINFFLSLSLKSVNIFPGED